TLYGNERRNFLKLNTPPFDVTVKLVESKDPIKQARKGTFMAVVLNISGGGVAIKSKKGELPLSAGDILELSVNLPDNPIHIEGKLLNIYQFESTGSLSFGIEFIQQHLDPLAFKKNTRSIIRYVVRRERELLSRR
ncbi:MAG: PilZ domain-containing protein, partial [bacterium]|nr:PilZ domain-containing protein [bacterium]